MEMLIFSSNDNFYALPIKSIVRILPALEVTNVPKSRKILYGVFDLHGKTIPVISFRELLSLAEKDMELEDALIILELHTHQIALLIDHILGVFNLEEEDSSDAKELFVELSTTHIVKYADKLTPVLDIDTLIDVQILHTLHNKEPLGT